MKDKKTCELKTEYCSGSCVATYQGTKKGDPVFNCCIACAAWLRRNRVKFRQVVV